MGCIFSRRGKSGDADMDRRQEIETDGEYKILRLGMKTVAHAGIVAARFLNSILDKRTKRYFVRGANLS